MLHKSMTRMGGILRSAREAKELTQESLAERIGASTRTIIAIEKNQRNLTCDMLYRLIHELDVSADLIFRPDDAPLATEQDQFIREFLDCEENEQRILISTLRSLIRALRQDVPEKQA